MHKRTKATSIPPEVKQAVGSRDNWTCIVCGSRGDPIAHVVNRSQGGMGVEENIVTLCTTCHREMDNGMNGPMLRAICEAYLREKYIGWSREKVIYDKWKGVFEDG